MTVSRNPSPCAFHEIENSWIPLHDGIRLATRIGLPLDAEARPISATFEFIPYSKRAGMARRDQMMHPWFAGQGYSGARADLPCSGDSESLLDDEYAPQEREDGLVTIDWLSSQSGCSGSVGMIEVSWGGFDGLQITARRPEPFKAIISVGSTDGAQLGSNFLGLDLLLGPGSSAGLGDRRRQAESAILIGRDLVDHAPAIRPANMTA